MDVSDREKGGGERKRGIEVERGGGLTQGLQLNDVELLRGNRGQEVLPSWEET